jgi:4-hydroxymandelate oxidase
MPNINLLDYEIGAKEVLSSMTWDYYSSGAGAEVTLQDNIDAFQQIKLRPRVLVDVSNRNNLQTTILGQTIDLPILLAPSAFQCLAHVDGELATAKAANQAGTMMMLSTLSTKSLEEVSEIRKSLNPHVGQIFQLYIHRDRGLTRSLVERAEAAGFCAICLTVDTPLLGKRERDTRNQFSLPPELELANFRGLDLAVDGTNQAESGLFAYFQQQVSPAITWADLDWLASISNLPIIVKGILRGDDAVRAIEHGVQAIVVSNHGGRQLDMAISTIDALAEVVTAVDGRCEVLVDGGIRRGVDILKALSFGANAVLIGRPVLWGLSVAGSEGVAHVLAILKEELSLAMALSGCMSLADIDRTLCTKI